MEPWLFAGETDQLSNLFEVDLNIDGVCYNSVEQFYQVEKARYGGNLRGVEVLMSAQSGRAAKIAARSIDFGNLAGWYPEVAQGVMRKALRVKFSADPFRSLLVSTYPRLLAENVVNMYWGIGLSPVDARRFNPAQWLGHNWMCGLLTEFKDEIRQEKMIELVPECSFECEDEREVVFGDAGEHGSSK